MLCYAIDRTTGGVKGVKALLCVAKYNATQPERTGTSLGHYSALSRYSAEGGKTLYPVLLMAGLAGLTGQTTTPAHGHIASAACLPQPDQTAGILIPKVQ